MKGTNWGADTPEIAEEVRAQYDPDVERKGNAVKGFAAFAVIFAAVLLAVYSILFVLGVMAHAVVNGWNAI